ncbi:MAG: T9SS type A sorting domain-containing protein [Rhodothermales bacterium]
MTSPLLLGQGFVYWANTGGDSIGRANLDGTSPNQSFITGAGTPYGLALDGNYIYWANLGGNTIGRANLDGTGADINFMTGLNQPAAVEVNATYIFWTSQGASTIGRANLDGTSPNATFITGANFPFGVRVNDTYIYWSNGGSTTLGRANLDGTSVNQSFITGATNPAGIDINATHIFWANSGTTTIGRANLDGTSASQTYITGGDRPGHVAVNGTHTYFTSQNDNTIGRANLDGTSADHNFITGANFPIGVDVVAAELPVELTTFTAVANNSTVVLRWETASETNNAGFEIQESTAFVDADESEWGVVDFVPGSGNSTSINAYEYAHADVEPGRYLYRLKQIDLDGAFEYSPSVEVEVELPGTHKLGEVYPNPFRGSSEFTLTVGRDQHVAVGLFDVTGRLVRLVHDGEFTAAKAHRVEIEAGGLPNGIYLLRVSAETFSESRSVVILR